ncbi:N-acetylmuramoyl-L-alanine amidase [Streptomyces rochei]|uniref:N-acetylmuramoyl-L-alanine amidase n=1 Tax=Streptomyces rochei TaxID=1928 RepID=UPI0037A40474
MGWYPAAIKMELQPESDDQPAIRPTQFIVHSIVAPWSARRTYEYWRDSTNLESHFGIDYAGAVGQYIGTHTRADANASANRRPDGTGAVSAETASNTSATDPWNDKQIEELIALGVWLHREEGIPLRICRSHDDPGYGYHSMFPQWSTSGTACPGKARIKQFREVVFPGIVARATGKTTTPATTEETDVPRYLSLGMTQPLTLEPGVWKAISWDTEWADQANGHFEGGQTFAHNAHYNGALHLRAAGVARGDEVQARVVEDENNGGPTVKHFPAGEVVGTSGDTYGWMPIVGVVGPDHRAKIQLCHFGAAPITIERAELKAHIWPR